jgi:CheY-like chemotaxis protein
MGKRKTQEVTKVVKNWIVLVVDNERENLALIDKVLSLEGAKVYTAGSAEEGLSMLEVLTPTFILLDLAMPHIDGWDMLKIVRENPVIQHLPVIALTAYSNPGDDERALTVGFDGYITKPFRVNTLLSNIQASLDSILTAGQGT